MAETRYQRDYRIEIGRNTDAIRPTLEFLQSEGTKTVVPTLIEAPEGFGGSVIKSNGRKFTLDIPTVVIRNLQMETVIHSVRAGKNASSKPTEIKIYNIDPKDLNQINKGDSLSLFAGYKSDGDLPRLYTGQILAVTNQRNGSDYITTIHCEDAALVKAKVRVAKNYPKNFTYLQVVQDLARIANEYGVPTGHIKLLSEEFVDLANTAGQIGGAEVTVAAAKEVKDKMSYSVGRGFPVYGYLIDELKKICESLGYTAFVLMNRLYIEPVKFEFVTTSGSVKVGSIKPTRAQITLTQDNLSGYVMPLSTFDGKGGDASGGDDGVKVKTFLTPEMTVISNMFLNLPPIDNPLYAGTTRSQLARETVRVYNTEYEVIGVKHKLNFEGMDWDTEITARKINKTGDAIIDRSPTRI